MSERDGSIFPYPRLCRCTVLSVECHAKSKKHLIFLFRRASNPSWSAPSRSITALNNARQVEEVQEDSADERAESAERVLPMFFSEDEPKQGISGRTDPIFTRFAGFRRSIVRPFTIYLHRSPAKTQIEIDDAFFAPPQRKSLSAEGSAKDNEKPQIPGVQGAVCKRKPGVSFD